MVAKMNDNLILETKEEMLYQKRVLLLKKSLPYVVLSLVVVIIAMVIYNIYSSKEHSNRCINTEKLLVAIEQKNKDQLHEVSNTRGKIKNLAKLNIYNIYQDSSILIDLKDSHLPLLQQYVDICRFADDNAQQEEGSTVYENILLSLSFLQNKKYNEAKALLHKLSNDNTMSSIEKDLIKSIQDEIYNNRNIRNNISN